MQHMHMKVQVDVDCSPVKKEEQRQRVRIITGVHDRCSGWLHLDVRSVGLTEKYSLQFSLL